MSRGSTRGQGAVPWRSERELGPDQVRALVRDQFGLGGDRVEELGSGWDSDAYRVDDEWVFRFPKRAEVVPSLRTELAVLPRLAPRLPLPVPEPRFVGSPAQSFPFPFAGYRMLPGVPAEDVPRVDRSRLLDQVLALLAALHSTEIAGPIAEVEGWGWDVAVQSERYVRRLELGDVPLLRRALDWLARRPLRTRGDRVLLHADLGLEHILVDASSRVTGIIDWGDMELGEPARDFIGLVFAAGLEGVEAALARSAYPAAPGLVDDARTLVVHTAVVHWCESIEFGMSGGTGLARKTLERFL